MLVVGRNMNSLGGPGAIGRCDYGLYVWEVGLFVVGGVDGGRRAL